ncbi:bifunctional glutamate N-acetyltransferase/amino-acid acetyltransferase ArgJ [Sulfurospirillum sp. hDNRA2]|uniref:bifunctional glutamate N-acetyltransferase/amino-acid acetyltransferase ArgJ n=1 Tax=Sulfurospirillum sp. hDNRA2 TaxID=3237298 RepID=UPI0020B6D30D|nr:bifunctional glutamate N-acetyltransferase/amino-acid acetyltransferase ArgJ [Sulfurospirillum sp. DNRA8]MCP3650748.1 bifunctional glutamate N-acetyltransferase/amino-acid acetyltransferase ArgJ [Sulfurospirillum sp. DNRA8]MCR1809593.1 bifunctional glutamate N-acetyltransferase/amino-acid acetyltransferase ArgJ [Sulfurospirillum sp. DNRA8]
MFTLLPVQNGLDNVEGFFCQGVHAGFKPNQKEDVAFIRTDEPCDVSGIFTSNVFQAAPIKHFLRYPKGFQTNFILMNAKNANAMTGEKGIEDIDTLFAKLQTIFPNLHHPIMSSTGVIGYRLNVDKMALAFEKFDFNAKDSHSTASAIMTTDSFKKELCLKVILEDGSFFHIAAICKGAGMINPAMATMLCFILTDAAIPKADMDALLLPAVQASFNSVSVDGDTSTNDTVLLLSSRKSGVYEKEAFNEALKRITQELSLMLVRDGEGSTKVVAFEVSGAQNDEEAERAAKALSNSLLVKTALFGEDPNWGRIASTIGASGITCSEETLVIHYDDILIYSKDQRSLDEQTEKKAAEVMKKASFRIRCELGIADGSFTAYGCDLGHRYVEINADYRT